MKWFRKVVDERQEQEMMRVEHSSFWVLFWGLSAAILVEIFVLGWSLREIAGEIIVLLVGAIWMLIGDLRYGSWDYFSKPGIKSYLFYSLAAGAIPAICIALSMYFRHQVPLEKCIPAFLIVFFMTWGAAFLMLWLLGTLSKRRLKKLQRDMEEDEPD